MSRTHEDGAVDAVTQPAVITFYTRQGCHLCDVALAELAALQPSHAFALHIVDLDHQADAEKRAAYDWEVPVMELNGRKIMKYRVDKARLLRLLEGCAAPHHATTA